MGKSFDTWIISDEDVLPVSSSPFIYFIVIRVRRPFMNSFVRAIDTRAHLLRNFVIFVVKRSHRHWSYRRMQYVRTQIKWVDSTALNWDSAAHFFLRFYSPSLYALFFTFNMKLLPLPLLSAPITQFRMWNCECLRVLDKVYCYSMHCIAIVVKISIRSLFDRIKNTLVDSPGGRLSSMSHHLHSNRLFFSL